MDRFIRAENVKRYRKLLERVTDEEHRKHIKRLLVEEERKQMRGRRFQHRFTQTGQLDRYAP